MVRNVWFPRRQVIRRVALSIALTLSAYLFLPIVQVLGGIFFRRSWRFRFRFDQNFDDLLDYTAN